MSNEKLHIKNMVCRRCVMTVEDICREIGFADASVSLGCIEFKSMPKRDDLERFYHRLREVGFEPLKSHEHVMMEKIKAALRFYARHYPCSEKNRLSDYLSDCVKLDFRYASRMFSSLEGRTIQSYLMSQRIEYVKELLSDNQLTLAEIADKVGFSSVAHLSRAFKKSQGITITEFRDMGTRLGIDEV